MGTIKLHKDSGYPYQNSIIQLLITFFQVGFIETILIALNFFLLTSTGIMTSLNRFSWLNSIIRKITSILTPIILYTVPFKYLQETIHRDFPSIALDYNYIYEKYDSRNLENDESLNLIILMFTVFAVCVKEYFLLIMIMKQADPNGKWAYLWKGIKGGILSQSVYYLHYITVRIVLTLLIFLSSDSNTILLLGLNMGLQLVFTGFHIFKIFDNFLLYA